MKSRVNDRAASSQPVTVTVTIAMDWLSPVPEQPKKAPEWYKKERLELPPGKNWAQVMWESCHGVKQPKQ